jgi:microsomal dipeptidase-like Zn-dependent dipeptidase
VAPDPQGARTWVASPEFHAHAPQLSFVVEGGGGTDAGVELLVDGVAKLQEAGPDGGTPKFIRWDIRPVASEAQSLTLRLTREPGSAPIAISDVHLSQAADSEPHAPLWGFADLHAHPVSQLAFGRHVMVGDNLGPMQTALKSCESEHGGGGAAGKAGPLMSFFELSYNGCVGHVTSGYPTFDGWPRYQSQVHQQMYIDWIKRAKEGGLRLLVALAVNNELLAKGFDGEGSYDDTSVTYTQIEAIKALASAGHDFMEVAYSAADARRIIGQENKLAIVIGVEVDAFGGCGNDASCDEAKVRATIRDLYCRGVRHYFPVHLADNALGGSSVYLDGDFNLLTWYVRGDYQHVMHDDSVAFTYAKATQDFIPKLYDLLFTANEQGAYPYSPPWGEYAHVQGGHVNIRGLSPLGGDAIDEMIKAGMIIDIDHMGERSRADTMTIAAARHAPLSMGHSWYRDLGFTAAETSDPAKLTNDAMKTGDEVDTVLRLGGVIAPITNQGDLKDSPGVASCGGASTSWLRAYTYAVARAGGVGVGFGTDFNGLAEEPNPRFGPLACIGLKTHLGDDDVLRAGGLTMQQALRRQAELQANGVSYSDCTPMHDVRTARFYGARSGSGAYTKNENAIWLAVASWKKGVKPPHADYELTGHARVIYDETIDGLFARSPPRNARARGAYEAVQGSLPSGSGSVETTEYQSVVDVLLAWSRMISGNTQHPLDRYTVPGGSDARDFDFNIDGLAHYGLLPDFLQDVSNQLKEGKGGAVKDLSALFRSAEAYVESWERAEAASEPRTWTREECAASAALVAKH